MPETHPIAHVLAAAARLASGVHVRAENFVADARQRIYFANHTSHLDFVVLWSALPRDLRARTRPVAAKDYWSSRVRNWVAARVFRAVLIERNPRGDAPAGAASAGTGVAAARGLIDGLVDALGSDHSLIIFPEGTRGSGESVAPFKSGMYHLAVRRPDVELVPVYLENLNRILPKGEILPAPLLSTATFGAALHLAAGESKPAFLTRARDALLALRRQ